MRTLFLTALALLLVASGPVPASAAAEISLVTPAPAAAQRQPAPEDPPSAADNGEFGWWPYVLLLGTLGALLTPGTVWPRKFD
ncbi:hypothetical protein [Streptomyces sp. 4F14]|uniref:hypothetical protein n=1 Tax=Streptomyces sp. 4F14 TaxID=3394380 RepID=UPI003A873975